MSNYSFKEVGSLGENSVTKTHPTVFRPLWAASSPNCEPGGQPVEVIMEGFCITVEHVMVE